jgi:hypothetical protein
MAEKTPIRLIFAVNTGSYSDYGIVALFSTAEKAQEFMAAVPHGDYNAVEEYELDPPTADMLRRGYSVWSVHMLRDGTVEETRQYDTDLYGVGGVGSFRIWERSKAPAYVGKGMADALTGNVWAKSEKQAVKAMNEKRLQMIAEGKWPAPSGASNV